MKHVKYLNVILAVIVIRPVFLIISTQFIRKNNSNYLEIQAEKPLINNSVLASDKSVGFLRKILLRL